MLSDGRSSFFDKVSAIINQCQTTESDQGGFATADPDITGASPMLCFFRSNILDTVGQVISSGLQVVGSMLGGVFGFAANVITAGVSLFRKGVKNLFDTMDLKSLADGQDASIANATMVYEEPYTQGQFEDLLHGEYGPAYQTLADHAGYYMAFPAIGATHYVGIASDGNPYPDTIWTMRYFIKQHVYNFGSGGYQIPGLGSLTSLQDVAQWMSQQPGCFDPLNIASDGDEIGYLRALMFSNQLIPLGLAVIDGNRSGQIDMWYNRTGNLYGSVNFTNVPWYNRRIPSSVTNLTWFTAATKLGWYDDDSISDDRKVSDFMNWALKQLLASISAIENDEIFYPYSWVVGQYSASFSILTDSEAARAFATSVTAIATVALVATGAVVGFKVKRFLKNKAYQARAAAERLMYETNPLPDPNVLRKAQRKAEKWERIAGLDGSSNITGTPATNVSVDSSNEQIRKILIGS